MCAEVVLCCPNVCCELYVCSAPSHGCQAEATQLPECVSAEGKEGGGICAVVVLCCRCMCHQLRVCSAWSPTSGSSGYVHTLVQVGQGWVNEGSIGRVNMGAVFWHPRWACHTCVRPTAT
jgi:hypothetical protein